MRHVFVDFASWETWPSMMISVTGTTAAPTTGSATSFTSAAVSIHVDGNFIPSTNPMGYDSVLRVISVHGSRGSMFVTVLVVPFSLSYYRRRLGLIMLGTLVIEMQCVHQIAYRPWKFFQSNDVSTIWAKDTILCIRSLIARDWNVLVVHIPREENNATDFLVRQASRDGSPYRVWKLTPFGLVSSICLDVYV